jgi:hypothetical protein
MATIALNGKFYHKGIGGDPVVILTVFDEGPFRDWCKANDVFTKIIEHRDPATGVERPAIYVTETVVAGMKEGSSVRITIDVRPESRGNGIRVVAVERTP